MCKVQEMCIQCHDLIKAATCMHIMFKLKATVTVVVVQDLPCTLCIYNNIMLSKTKYNEVSIIANV